MQTLRVCITCLMHCPWNTKKNKNKEIKLSVYCLIVRQGAGKEIREAIADPQPQCQEKAWNAVLPLVTKLRRCYEHSMELERVVPKLLSQLVGGRLNPTQHLETQQALVKQLAEILEFVLKFDEFKVWWMNDADMIA